MKVSVAVPCYNEEFTIARCLESLLKQPYPDYEVFVYDNMSTDNTVREAKRYEKDPRFHVIEGKEHYKSAANGIDIVLREYANGEIGTWINGDDYILPNYFTTLVPYFLEPRIGFVRITVKAYFDTLDDMGVVPQIEWNKLEDILNENKMFPGCPFRMQFFKDVGGMDKNMIFYDWDFWIRGVYEGVIYRGWRYATCPVPVEVRMIHGEWSEEKMKKDLLEVFNKYNGKNDTTI